MEDTGNAEKTNAGVLSDNFSKDEKQKENLLANDADTTSDNCAKDSAEQTPEGGPKDIEQKPGVRAGAQRPRNLGVVSELHISAQVLVGRFHDAVFTFPGRASKAESSTAKVSIDGYVQNLKTAGENFERLISELPPQLRLNSSAEASEEELREIHASDEAVSAELAALAERAEALQSKTRARLRQTLENVTSDTVSIVPEPSDACDGEGEGADSNTTPVASKGDSNAGVAPVSIARNALPKLQDLVQEKGKRFVEELEFVEALSNPDYVQWLAMQPFFNDPAFEEFLKYLCYWRKSPFVEWVVYPQALGMLHMLCDPTVRAAVHKTDMRHFMVRGLLRHWASFAEDVHMYKDTCAEPKNSETPAETENKREKAETPVDNPQRPGSDVLRDCDVQQDWTALSGVTADKVWHKNVAGIDVTKQTVQCTAEGIGWNFLAKQTSKTGQELQATFQKFRHFWRTGQHAGNLSRALTSLRSEPVPADFRVPGEALKSLLPKPAPAKPPVVTNPVVAAPPRGQVQDHQRARPAFRPPAVNSGRQRAPAGQPVPAASHATRPVFSDAATTLPARGQSPMVITIDEGPNRASPRSGQMPPNKRGRTG